MLDISLKKRLSSESGGMLFDISLKIENGEFVAVTGPSGSGKTSLLRMVAGIMKPDSGRITVNGTEWYDSGQRVSLHPNRRGAGYVFQDYALFPNMTLRENILYACGDRTLTDSLIELSGLEGVSEVKPDRLSGGQKQRCAILRTISLKPQLLLLDEPFSALDSAARNLFQRELIRWRELAGVTVVMVSHDRGETIRLADRIISISEGNIVSDISPRRGCIVHALKPGHGVHRAGVAS